jgi:formylglycine-generating enzyme required for sulfatase activity/tRNA A-37 threonylcarbamoyl transferase component Bud32
MSIASAAELVAVLRQLQLLKPALLDELARKVESRNIDPKALAQQLVERGLLTPFQCKHLLQGTGPNLVLGPYVLMDRIGAGGMGQVFKARHQKLHRIVAVKVIHKDRIDNPQAVKRFQREFRAAAHLSHPNVVHAYDADEVNGTPMLVMEYVEGIDLACLVQQRGRLPAPLACEYIRQAALGLQHAHERGMVHRDIKPSNLLLQKPRPGATGPVVKLLDLGLARMESSSGESSPTLTNAGTLLGTLDFIAPEQTHDAHKADIRSDLYSLGVTFFYLLTGQLPFPVRTVAEKIYKHQYVEAPAVDTLCPDVPAEVSAIVRKLLAKRPEDRFQTPAALAEALAPAALSFPPDATWSYEPPLSHTVAADTVVPDGAAPTAHEQRPLPGRQSRKQLLVASCLMLGLTLALVLAFREWSSNAQIKAESTKPDPVSEPEKQVANSIGMKLTYVPPGTFLMGSTPEAIERFRKEPHFTDTAQWDQLEGPQHEVRLARPFYLGIYEVTQAEYEKIIGTNPSVHRDGPAYPVGNVTWDEAVEFCRKLSALPAERMARRVYRLPNEAEWEYACRAGKPTAYHWGDSLSPKEANIRSGVPGQPDPASPAVGKPTKVGSYAPNAWGLYDMHGNVWEWCLDGTRDYTPTPVRDPRGPDTPSARMMRGGSWDNEAWNSRSAFRNPHAPGERYPHVGFRVLLER